MPHPVAQEIMALIEPVLDEMQVELVDVEYVTQRGRWVLRVYIDKQGGVTLDDCAEVSREIGDIIDVSEIIRTEYVLEVSSPGLNRPLRRERDFAWAVGKKIKIRVREAVEGRRNFTGRLEAFKDGMLSLKTETGRVAIALAAVEKANRIYEFDEI